MLKKYGFAVVGTLILGTGIGMNSFINSAVAQHYQILQPDGKDVIKEGEEGKTEKKAEGEKEEKCPECGHLPSKPESECRCDCHHRHKGA
ncbi:MAG: hypothetical protein E3K32_12745 [wastewater metagenome]|nr:hypothetical protein [Candidatus Loosdrechtia aerotolerans]